MPAQACLLVCCACYFHWFRPHRAVCQVYLRYPRPTPEGAAIQTLHTCIKTRYRVGRDRTPPCHVRECARSVTQDHTLPVVPLAHPLSPIQVPPFPFPSESSPQAQGPFLIILDTSSPFIPTVAVASSNGVVIVMASCLLVLIIMILS